MSSVKIVIDIFIHQPHHCLVNRLTMVKVDVISNKSIAETRIDDCETGLSVVSQQQQESDTQEEEVSDRENPNIENMSSNITESLHVNIVGLDQIVCGGGKRLSSEKDQIETNLRKFVHRVETRDNNRIWFVIIFTFFLVCFTTIFVNKIDEYTEQPIDRFQVFSFSVLVFLISCIYSKCFFLLLWLIVHNSK